MQSEQERSSRCDFIDVLEEAVVLKRKVRVRKKDGDVFVDRVVDVPTENGRDYAVFENHGKIALDDLTAAARA